MSMHDKLWYYLRRQKSEGSEQVYSYNDNNDTITGALIRKVSRGSYWEESEDRILNLCKSELYGKSITNFIDLGCGMGRLIPVFLPFAETLYAVEPDSERYKLAEKSWKSRKANYPGKHVIMIHGDIHSVSNSYQGVSFDAAVSSHVLQHIPYSLAEDMFQTLSDTMIPGGILFVMTTAPQYENNVYTKEFLDKNGVHQTKQINQEQFEKAFTEIDALPVVCYTVETIERLFDRAGFDMIKTVGFHYCCEENRFATLDDDITYQANNDLTHARDALYILKKRM